MISFDGILLEPSFAQYSIQCSLFVDAIVTYEFALLLFILRHYCQDCHSRIDSQCVFIHFFLHYALPKFVPHHSGCIIQVINWTDISWGSCKAVHFCSVLANGAINRQCKIFLPKRIMKVSEIRKNYYLIPIYSIEKLIDINSQLPNRHIHRTNYIMAIRGVFEMYFTSISKPIVEMVSSG